MWVRILVFATVVNAAEIVLLTSQGSAYWWIPTVGLLCSAVALTLRAYTPDQTS